MDLRNQQIKETYGNLATINTVAGTPTTGVLQNGAGSNVTTLTIAGTLDATTLGGTLSTAAQTNITSVGTLTGLTVSGDANFDSGTLFVDVSENKVGIGTSSPPAKLSLEGVATTVGDSNYHLSIADTASAAQGVGGGILFIGAYTGSTTTSGGFIQTEKSNATDGNFAFDLVLGSRANGSPPAERMRIDSSGNVGIGVTPSAWRSTEKALMIGSGSLHSYLSAGINITSNSYINSSNQDIQIVNGYASRYLQAVGTGEHIFYTAPLGTAGNPITFSEKVKIDSDGLKFNGDTAAANALDDYEEGTFTPSFSMSTSGTITMGTTTGRYTKIGNLVTFTGYANINTVASPVGDFRLGGLPLTVGTGGDSSVSIYVYGFGNTTTVTAYQAYIEPGDTYAVIRGFNNGDQVTNITANIQGGVGIIFNITFRV